MTRTVRSRRAEIANQPLYSRALRLRHLAPSGLLCFVFLEGAVVLGILLALAELVSWWGVLVLPITVAFMVKFNDLIAGALTQQPVTTEPTTARAPVLRPAAMSGSEGQTAVIQAVTDAPAVEHRMTGPGFGFAPAGSARDGAVFGFPGSEQRSYEQRGSEQRGSEQRGYEQQGYERSGYEHQGYERQAYEQQGYELRSYEQSGHEPSGYEQPGHERFGYEQPGDGRTGYEQPGFEQQGYQRPGYEQSGYQQSGYQQSGYQQAGYEQSGFERAGAQFRLAAPEESEFPAAGQAFGAAQPEFGNAGAGFATAGIDQSGYVSNSVFTHSGQGGSNTPARSGFSDAGEFTDAGSGQGGAVFGLSGAGHGGFGYAGGNESHGSRGHAAGQHGYGPVQPSYGYPVDDAGRPGIPATNAPVRRQWVDELDVRQQMARQSAVRRYE